MVTYLRLEQAANLLLAQASLASYPQRVGKYVAAVADWGDGMSAGCKPWFQLLFVDAGNGSVAHANQLPLSRLQSASGHESDWLM